MDGCQCGSHQQGDPAGSPRGAKHESPTLRTGSLREDGAPVAVMHNMGTMAWVVIRAVAAGLVVAVAAALIFSVRALCSLAYTCHLGAVSCTPPMPTPCGHGSPNVIMGGAVGLAVAVVVVAVQRPWRRPT